MESETQKKEVQPKKKDFFELIIDHPNQTSPFLQFSWCVNNKGIEYLQEKKVLHPFLLIVVLNKEPQGNDYKDYERQLYPLDRGLGHIEFNQPGKYKIHASVVWTYRSAEGGKQNYKDAWENIYDYYMEEDGDKFIHKLHDKVSYRSGYLRYPSLPYHDEIEVIVDENLFAPEPSYHMKWWVNMLWHGKKPKNQCEWRQRKIIAFTIQPFLILIFLAFRYFFAIAYTALLIAIGFYPNRIGWKAIIHPFDKDLEDIADNYELKSDYNYWWLVKTDKKERPTSERVLLCPLTAYMIAFIVSLAVDLNIFRIEIIPSFIKSNDLLICLGMAIVAMITGLIFFKITKFIVKYFFAKKLQKQIDERGKVKTKKEEELYLANLSYFYEQRLQPLACNKRTREATLSSLPPTHRTLWLRFMDLKTKVCKPFRG